MERFDHNRLSAFTILELIVVLTISSLVIALGYSSYQLINRFYTSNLGEKEAYEAKVAMSYQLQEDFNLSSSSTLSNRELEIIRKQDTVYYEWQEEFMLRKVRQVMDTFAYDKHQLIFFYEGEESTMGLIDEIHFNMNEHWPLLLKKEYSATSKMKNRELLNGN